MGIPERVEREKETEQILAKKMTDNFYQLMFYILNVN